MLHSLKQQQLRIQFEFPVPFSPVIRVTGSCPFAFSVQGKSKCISLKGPTFFNVKSLMFIDIH